MPTSPHGIQVAGLTLVHSHTQASWLAALILGSAPLCYPAEVQSLLSRMLQLVRGRVSSPALMTPALSVLPAIWGEEQGKKRVSLPLAYNLTEDEWWGRSALLLRCLPR